jgi:hypothetical protein
MLLHVQTYWQQEELQSNGDPSIHRATKMRITPSPTNIPFATPAKASSSPESSPWKK